LSEVIDKKYKKILIFLVILFEKLRNAINKDNKGNSKSSDLFEADTIGIKVSCPLETIIQ